MTTLVQKHGMALVVLFLLLWFLSLISGVILPFVVAMLAAYFLDPAADKLEAAGLSRLMSTIIIVVAFFLILGAVLLALVPPMYQQLLELLGAMPAYINELRDLYEPQFQAFVEQISSSDKVKKVAEDGAVAISSTIFNVLQQSLINILQSGSAAINILSLIFITPIITFYLLRDWDVMMDRLEGWLPPQYHDTVKEQMIRIDQTISGWLRGQILVCVILGTYYALALSIFGLKFGLIIGVSAGVLAFIPYVGSIAGLVTSITVAWFQFHAIEDVAIVAGIFLFGQLVEGNFLTPKIVGENIGLHPVWVIFGMLVGGSLFGFVGIFLAVPVTAIIAVLVRFAFEQYLQSEYFVPKSKNAKKK